MRKATLVKPATTSLPRSSLATVVSLARTTVLLRRVRPTLLVPTTSTQAVAALAEPGTSGAAAALTAVLCSGLPSLCSSLLHFGSSTVPSIVKTATPSTRKPSFTASLLVASASSLPSPTSAWLLATVTLSAAATAASSTTPATSTGLLPPPCSCGSSSTSVTVPPLTPKLLSSWLLMSSSTS